jgi:ornithine cyclodeaminase/alanine dehydrogenase-like protein (mu-crystallin family)
LRQRGAREEKCHVLAPASPEVLLVDTLAALQESGDLIGPLARGIVAREDISLLGALIATKTAAPGI